MNTGFFITGTDTHVGKTWTTAALLRKFSQNGLQVAGMKPVASGCIWQDNAYKNADALLIADNISFKTDYALINPYAFAAPVSPHLACGNIEVELSVIKTAFSALADHADVMLVEGAGGWLSPLSQRYSNADLAVFLQLPVILVVGMRLGCINHALLSYQAIEKSGCPCAGWVAVTIDPDMQYLVETQEYLQQHLPAPLLGVLPYSAQGDFDFLAACLNPDRCLLG